MAVVDREGTVTGANAALAELLGRDQDTLTGAVAADLVDLGSDARTWHAYRELLRGRRARLRCTRRLKHPEGHALWVRVTVAPLPPTTAACCCPSPTSATTTHSSPGCGTCASTTR